jgi:hypothetical protein
MCSGWRGQIPAPLGLLRVHFHYTVFLCTMHWTQLYILMDRMEPLILGLPWSRTCHLHRIYHLVRNLYSLKNKNCQDCATVLLFSLLLPVSRIRELEVDFYHRMFTNLLKKDKKSSSYDEMSLKEEVSGRNPYHGGDRYYPTDLNSGT